MILLHPFQHRMFFEFTILIPAALWMEGRRPLSATTSVWGHQEQATQVLEGLQTFHFFLLLFFFNQEITHMKENKRHHQVHSLCALQLHEELLLYLPLYTQCQQPGTALQLCGLLSMHSNKVCQGWLLAVSVRGHQPLQVAQPPAPKSTLYLPLVQRSQTIPVQLFILSTFNPKQVRIGF